jgi:hypothetical protein
MRQRLPLLLAALWWGSLCAVGFWVVPLLFIHLPTPALAGGMAAKLFGAQTWVALLCGLVLLLLSRDARAGLTQPVIGLVLAGLLLALLSEFAVAPRIVARDNLALWHRVGSGLYFLQWLCAGAVLWKVSTPKS